MQIFKKYKFFLRILVAIPQILSFFLITSCTLKNYEEQSDSYLFNNIKNQFQTLIVPKEITLPPQNKKYYVPYKKEDLDRKNYDIFPPL